MNTTIDTPLGPMAVRVFSATTVHGAMTVTHPTAGTEWFVEVPARRWGSGPFEPGWDAQGGKVGGQKHHIMSGPIADLIKERLAPALIAWANAHLDEIDAYERANQIARLVSDIADMESRLAAKREQLAALVATGEE